MNSTQYFLLQVVLRYIQFFVLLCLTSVAAFIIKKIKNVKRPLGVTILACLYLAASLDQLIGYVNFPYYAYQFQQIAFPLLVLRFVVSISLRLVGIMIASGLLFLKEWARKGILLISVFYLLLLPWKHPLFAFQNLSRLTHQQFPNSPPIDPAFGRWGFLILDMMFYGVMLFYFQRRLIKQAFRGQSSSQTQTPD